MAVKIPVYVVMRPKDAGGLVRFANTVQGRFSFGNHVSTDAIPVQIIGSSHHALFEASLGSGVTISAWQTNGICHYLGIAREVYYLVAIMLGLTQWRTLHQNPLLIGEDLMHLVPHNCLFANQSHIQNYALLLEKPFICPDCIEFYRCMGAEPEIEALLKVLSYLDSLQQSPPPGDKEQSQPLIWNVKGKRELLTNSCPKWANAVLTDHILENKEYVWPDPH